MTTTSLDHQAMDFASLEDKMELANSPFPHLEDVEDLDFEFDQMDHRPPEPPTDNMMDDATEPGDAVEELETGGDVEFLDEQNEEETVAPDPPNEFAMDEAGQDNQEDDEEILYEEEEDSTVVVNKPDNPSDKYLQNSEQDAEDLFEPDETVPPDSVDGQETSAPHNIDTDLGDYQTNDNMNVPQDNSNSPQEEDQTTRDDGDGPALDPTLTEYQEDPDIDRQAQRTQADLKVEESFEDTLDEEEANSVFPEDHKIDAIETPANAANSIQQNTAAELQDNARIPQDELHPVRVVYQGAEYSLFPPTGDDSTSYFLEDPSLAAQPLDVLLKSCREVVGKPEDLDHHDELVLDVPTMGLHICEDSRYATQIKLSDVVEVYVLLNRNESREQIEPLYCSLTTRVCLATQFNWLRDQAKDGFAFSHIAAQHVDTPIEDNEDADPAPAQGDADGGAKDPVEAVYEEELEVQTIPKDASYPADALYSHEPSDERVETNMPIEEVVGADSAYTVEDPQLESGAVASSEEGHDTVFAPTTVPESEAAHSAYDADPGTAVPEPEADTEVSEFFQDAIDEPIEDEEEDVQEAAEDQSVLREAVAEEQVEAHSLLADEKGRDDTFNDQNEYDADEFLINSDDEEAAVEDTAQPEHSTDAKANDLPPPTATNGHHVESDQLPVQSTDSPGVDPVTPSKKTSKRKVSDEEDDFVLDLDTPEPKRRRPS